MPIKTIKTAFNAGELSEYLSAREDINKYHNGCSKLINATVLPHGGFVKRPGTQYIATAPNKNRLIPFEFSVDDALVLEFSNLLTRFYKDGAQIFVPYGTEDLSDFDSASGDSSLVAHWKCDDNAANTTVVDGTVAGSHDGDTQANTSTLTTTDAAGTVNEALDLDGSDYVTVGDHANFSFGDGSNDSPFSIAAWVFFEEGVTTQAVITKYDPPDNAEWKFNVLANTDQVRFQLFDESTAGFEEINTVGSLTTGKWYFIVATYDGRGGADAAAGMNIYIDRVKVDTTVSSNGNYIAMESLAADVIIGAQNVGADFLWQGKIDNVAVFNKELSAVEVAALTGPDSTTPYSIVSPYTSAQAFDVHVTQSADVMYLAHASLHPQKLSRLADTSWKIENVPFTHGPFLDENITDTHLLGFARTGGVARAEYYFPTGATGTLTATAHSPFNANHVGSLWLVKHTRDKDNKTTTFAKDTNVVPTLTTFASGAVFIKGDYTLTLEPVATGKSARLWRKAGNAPWQEVRSFVGTTSYSATEDEDNVLYAMTRSDNSIGGTLSVREATNRGIVKVTSVTNSGVAVVEVIDKVYADNSTDNAVTTFQWAEGAWNDYRGFPRTVTFFEDRLWWASSTNNPDTLWSSKSGQYENMEFTALGVDNDAVTAPLNDNEVSQIQWMFSRQVMAIGSANKEYRFGASNPDDPVTPTDRKATPQTAFSSGSIQPALLNDSIFFFQRQGKKLGAMKFDAITENFDVIDSTLLAYGLFDSAPTNMAVQRSPDSIIWVVRTDGVLPTLTYEPAEEVVGWARQIFGNSAAVETATGFVESVAVIHGSSEDEVWVSIRRVISSSTVYYIERFKARDWGTDIEDACYVDSAITYDSTLAATVTAAHLKGETLAVFADGEVFDDAVADASTGVITLKKGGAATSASVVQYGLPYTMKVRTMRASVPQEGNTIQTRIKRVHSVVIRFVKSLLGFAGQEYGGVEYLTSIGATFSDEAKDTGEDNRLIEGGNSEEAYVIILSDDPVPFTGLAAIISYEVEERR